MGTDLKLVIPADTNGALWIADMIYMTNRDYEEYDRLEAAAQPLPEGVSVQAVWDIEHRGPTCKTRDAYSKPLTYVTVKDVMQVNLAPVNLWGEPQCLLVDKLRDFRPDLKVILYWN